jgi:class 3 adenylate cyclase
MADQRTDSQQRLVDSPPDDVSDGDGASSRTRDAEAVEKYLEDEWNSSKAFKFGSLAVTLSEEACNLRSFLERYNSHFPSVASIFLHAQNTKIPSTLLGQLQASSGIRDTVDEEILSLRKQLREMSEKVNIAKSQIADADEQRKKISELLKKEQLQSILSRTSPDAHEQLLKDEAFRISLTTGSTDAFVMSIDLRRSTELMLKARSPELFAEFVQAVAMSLRTAVLAEYGVFDKFTGDGILAFFPVGFSGDDAGYRAIRAASRCHSNFSELYKEHRKCFDVVLRDIGLGIGIDFGQVNIATIGDLTVVGTPVVYACRLGAAPAGHTYLNQTAYEVVSEMYEQNMLFNETSLEFKHEGAMIAYDVQLSHVGRIPSRPKWACDAIANSSLNEQSAAPESLKSDVPPNGTS